MKTLSQYQTKDDIYALFGTKSFKILENYSSPKDALLENLALLAFLVYESMMISTAEHV